ncbi:MAG: hypothetical protein ACRD4R_08020 [Candidatus Acidiferrales bacterium]
MSIKINGMLNQMIPTPKKVLHKTPITDTNSTVPDESAYAMFVAFDTRRQFR